MCRATRNMRTDDVRELYIQERLQRWGQATASACVTCASGHSPDKVMRVSSNQGRGLEVSKEEKADENIVMLWYLLEYVLKFLVHKHMSLDDCPKGIEVHAALWRTRRTFPVRPLPSKHQSQTLGLCARFDPARAADLERFL